MDGEVGKKLFAKLETKGLHGLAFWDNGFKQMSANKPLRTVADFKGLKMRIQSSKVLDAQMKALGANPQVMAFSEVYTGAAAGRGGWHRKSGPDNLYTQKMHEVQKHLTVSDHGYLGYAVIVNKKFWEGLPADIRATLDTGHEGSHRCSSASIAKEENDDALAKVHAAKTTEIYVLPNEERAEWHEALLPVHKEFEGIDRQGPDPDVVTRSPPRCEKEKAARQNRRTPPARRPGIVREDA